MAEAFTHFGGIDFSGAREPLANLWSAVGVESGGKLCIHSVRPHAFRKDLARYVLDGWRTVGGSGATHRADGPREEGDQSTVSDDHRVLWGADFPFGLPTGFGALTGAGESWSSILDWIADRAPDEVRQVAGDMARTPRATDTGGALPPLDMRLYKQTVEGSRWLQGLREETEIRVEPLAPSSAPVALIEVYPSATVIDLGLPRRRTPSRPSEIRARAAALRTFMEFASPDCESLVVTLEDAWDAAIACLTAFLCRDDLGQPFRLGSHAHAAIRREGWIYRPPGAVNPDA